MFISRNPQKGWCFLGSQFSFSKISQRGLVRRLYIKFWGCVGRYVQIVLTSVPECLSNNPFEGLKKRLWKPKNVYTGSYKELSWRITFTLENCSWWFMMEGVMFSKFDSKEIELTFAPIIIEEDRLFKFDYFQPGSHLRFSLWNITWFLIVTKFWRLINIWEAQPHEFSLVQGYFVDFSRTVRGEPQPQWRRKVCQDSSFTPPSKYQK